MDIKVSPEMRLFSPEGEPLYLNEEERIKFLDAVRNDTDRNAIIFCLLLAYTGARPTELRELTVDRLLVGESIVILRWGILQFTLLKYIYKLLVVKKRA